MIYPFEFEEYYIVIPVDEASRVVMAISNMLLLLCWIAVVCAFFLWRMIMQKTDAHRVSRPCSPMDIWMETIAVAFGVASGRFDSSRHRVYWPEAAWLCSLSVSALVLSTMCSGLFFQAMTTNMMDPPTINTIDDIVTDGRFGIIIPDTFHFSDDMLKKFTRYVLDKAFYV